MPSRAPPTRGGAQIFGLRARLRTVEHPRMYTGFTVGGVRARRKGPRGPQACVNTGLAARVHTLGGVQTNSSEDRTMTQNLDAFTQADIECAIGASTNDEAAWGREDFEGWRPDARRWFTFNACRRQGRHHCLGSFANDAVMCDCECHMPAQDQ